jgi:hypothetical protein
MKLSKSWFQSFVFGSYGWFDEQFFLELGECNHQLSFGGGTMASVSHVAVNAGLISPSTSSATS